MVEFLVLLAILAQPPNEAPSPLTMTSYEADSASESAVEEPHNPPCGFRWLTLEPLPGAAEALREVLFDPQDSVARDNLKLIYETGGFTGAARFVENTMRAISGKSLVTEPVEDCVAWSASELDLLGSADQSALGISRLVASGDFRGGVALAEHEIEEHGLSLAVAVQWADAYTWMAIMDPSAVSVERLEVAVRIYLTSLSGVLPRSVGTTSVSGGFDRVSDLFFRLGDHVSASTAAQLAALSLDTSDSESE